AQVNDLVSRMTADAQQMWFMDPANQACGACINEDVLSCATMNGCDDEAGNLQCCLATACASATTQAEATACAQREQAAGGMCATEGMGLVGCANGTLMSRTCGISPTCIMP
ncbi:MAG: hypothetical protein AAGE52_13330, partial [Myxococcota bacterium]